jgi:hypothetical protein
MLDKPLAEVFATKIATEPDRWGKTAAAAGDHLVLRDPINGPGAPLASAQSAQSTRAASGLADFAELPVDVADGAVSAGPSPVDHPAEAELAAGGDAGQQPGMLHESAMVGLDEDQLRVLVRGMVRSELQGDLGMRMSRNIRKVLRAEIAKALSLHGIS